MQLWEQVKLCGLTFCARAGRSAQQGTMKGNGYHREIRNSIGCQRVSRSLRELTGTLVSPASQLADVGDVRSSEAIWVLNIFQRLMS